MLSRNLLFAATLCTFAALAAHAGVRQQGPAAPASAATVVARAENPEGKLIKTADAQTVQGHPAVARPARPEPAEAPRRHGTGAAMLLTAIGVMLAIALRRIGSAGR